MIRLYLIIALALGALATAPAGAAEEAARPPAEAFTEQPLLSNFSVSPDGEKLLAWHYQDKEWTLAIWDQTDDVIRDIAKRDVLPATSARWLTANKLLIKFARNYFLSGFGILDLTTQTFEVVDMRSAISTDVLYVSPDGGWFLLNAYRQAETTPSVYRYDVATGDVERVQSKRAGVDEWFVDDAGVVRAGLILQKKRWKMIYRASEADDWNQIAKADYDDEDSAIEAVRIVSGKDIGLVLSADPDGRYGVYEMDFVTREYSEPIFLDDVHDVSSMWTSRRSGDLIAVSLATDKGKTVWFDDGMKRLQEAVEQAVPGADVTLVDANDDMTHFVVYAAKPGAPGEYFLLDRTKREMKRLLLRNYGLEKVELGQQEYVTIPARDRLPLHAVVTRPVHTSGAGPLLIYPHGGPFGVRDQVGYDVWAQFLASRGYTVIQPNFRGSGGYGESFSDAGDAQVGYAMQDDLDDVMDWAVMEGLADPERVCIIGSSYGGYAALWGATRNPERYRCAISFAGVTSLKRILHYDGKYFGRSSAFRRFRDKYTGEGDGKRDLSEVSPLEQVDHLQRPVLVAHGGDDSTVPFSQSDLYKDALEKAGKVYEFYRYEDIGHGFSDPEKEADFLRRVEAFLQKYNPAGAPAPADSAATE